MSSEPFEYSGTENLEVMACAVNYNRFLLNAVATTRFSGKAVVDFGAGIGTFASALSPLGISPLCVEPDEKQRAVIAARNLQSVSSIDEIPDSSVDFLYSLNVMEHIPDDVGTLERIRKKVRSGGRLFVYVPAFAILFSDMDRLVGHVRRYRASELAQKVKTAGFHVDECDYADSLGFAAALAYRLVDKSGGQIDERALRTYDRFAFPLSRLLDKAGLRYIAGKNVMLRATAP